MMRCFSLVSVAFLALLVSCQKTSELDIPSYISIDTIRLEVTSEQGTAYNKIVDAWVYTDNDLEGAFELPAKFPVLKSGASEIRILPGIKLNGIAETRAAYPFFNPIVVPVTLKHENVTNINNLKTTYNIKTVFAWIEDFENPNITLDTTINSDVKIVRVGDPALSSILPGESNHWAAKVSINNDSSYFECVSHNDYKFTNNGDIESSVFMELNYKTNCKFTVGLIAYGSQTLRKPVLVINPSSSWNKIYINFTPTILANSNATKFKVYFTAQKAENGPDAEILFDNIKLLHF